MIGLFLGAGASYECGMPLVWEFSNTLRVNILKRINTKLFNFNDNKELKRKFIELLANENLHYEQVVGEIEEIYLNNNYANNQLGDEASGVLLQLIECIQLLLFEEQKKSSNILKAKMLDFYGIKKLVVSCIY